MPSYKYNRYLQYELDLVKHVMNVFFSEDKTHLKIITPQTARELLAFIYSATHCYGQLTDRSLPMLGLHSQDEINMVRAMMAHSPYYICGGCLVVKMDLVDTVSEMFIPEPHEAEMLVVHSAVSDEGLNFGYPSHPTFEDQ